MRKYLLAAAAAAAISTPAVARDGSFYVGADLGLMKPQDTLLQTTTDFGGTIGVRTATRGLTVDYNNRYDADLNAGYDFGMFRVEGEVAYKNAGVQDVRLDETLLANLTTAGALTTPLTNDNFHLFSNDRFTNRLRVLSGMVNALLDFGDDQWGGFAGAGAGVASVHLLGDSSSKFALQGIAGLRYGLSPNLDLSIKYRYFVTGKLNFSNDFDLGTAGVFPFSANGHLHTHSILLGLTYNFAPPPPPPPATQTCPDGSVIPATAACPAPPPPPPPPPAPTQRGERGQ